MEHQAATTSRIHPLVAGAAVAVTAVSLLSMAALTGIISPSHALATNGVSAPAAVMGSSDVTQLAPVAGSNDRRYQAADGEIFEVAPRDPSVAPVVQMQETQLPARHRTLPAQAPVVHHRQAHHYTQPTFHAQHQQYAQNTYNDLQPGYQPEPAYQQPAQAHPVLNYVNDMHPVGTGVGAVVGGLLGNQIGGGNGKKIATLAGVLLGGYTGNEVAHNRNPLN